MRHTSGLTYGFFGEGAVKKAYIEANLNDGDPDNAEFADRLAKLPLVYQPGTTWEYSQSTDVLGRVIEVVSGKSLYQIREGELLDPLGMKDTSFYVTDRPSSLASPNRSRMTAPSASAPTVNDPRVAANGSRAAAAWSARPWTMRASLQMLLNGGALDGKRYLGPKTIAYMTSDHMGAVIKPRALLTCRARLQVRAGLRGAQGSRHIARRRLGG